ncbi:hypothetical protein KIPE111705_12665 [Kibdelosporangium persicum]|uniref:Uncharacterized protein n=1 Tax=Kibdelosporangium persicum TaxID=2698649 RepID=A0ABX2F9J0_9PSEU|nr:hypothetical protein [Kibdelosporangium persicum]NRN68031.1 hypothetical protein [Kibdelosporangium persicum]
MTQQWIRAACDPSIAGGTAAHIDAHVLSLVDGRGLAADIVCTQVDRSSTVATVAMTARLVGPPEQLDGVEITTAETGASGRCVRFPGQSGLTGVHSIAEITAASAIDEVVAVGNQVTPDILVDTRGFLRPEYQDGRLVLLVEPAAGGMVRPIEIEQPHQCCGGTH